MSKRNFKNWLATFKSSISTYDYYVDFDKVYLNVEKIKIELNILNSLIGSKNIKNDFIELVNRYPDTLKCIPILLAVRANSVFTLDGEGERLWAFSHANHPVEDYAKFMEKSGLFGLISAHIIRDLVDYVTGVETGLDSNARKNRGGRLMENLVESFIAQCRHTYFAELKTTEVSQKWGTDLSAITNEGKAIKLTCPI